MRKYKLLPLGLCLIMLAGCGNNAIVESPLSSGCEADLSTTENITQSDVSENSKTAPSSQEEQSASHFDEGSPIETTDPPETQQRPESSSSQQAPEARNDTPVSQSAEPTSSPKPAEKSVAPSPSETEPPITDPIAEPVVITKPTPEPEPPKPQFDIQYWIGYAQSYAEGVGLHLNSEAVYCWDNPITAGVNSTCLDRDIQSRLGRYSRDEDITDVWIWAEPRSDGSYDLYIGYA